MRTKSRKADLEGKKILFFEIGLAVALSLALVAFEWNSQSEFTLPINPTGANYVPYDKIPITRPEEITPPPPPIVVIETILIHDNIAMDIKENPDPFGDISEDILPTLLARLNINDGEDEIDEPIPFVSITQKPTFMGGDQNTFSRWVARNLSYPEQAAINGIQGRVTLQFMIDTDGSIKNVKVIKGVDKLLDEEAIRVVSSSPAWSPGMQRDKPARVIFTFPVTFSLQN